ncbi:MAG: hypothetical protein R3B72_30140 [Polyangiaceae bacterium]
MRAAISFLGLVILGTATFVACGDDETGTGGSGATGGSTSSSGGQGGVGEAGSTGGGGASQGGMGGAGGMGGEGGMGGGCTNSLPTITVAPNLLSQTGLYADIVAKTISADVLPYEPRFKLWSDGVEKARFAYLPECDVIDNTDEDDWSFPVGTRMWKDFSENGVLLETRLIHRYGPGPSDFLFATYQWNSMQTEATFIDSGVDDVLGTAHDIPPTAVCGRCHGPHPSKGGLPSRFLGFSALQLSHTGPGATMQTLSDGGYLLAPNAAGYTVPGTPTDQAALGYLHANCANCHNDSADGLFFPMLDMRLRVADTMVDQTAAYQSLVNQLIGNFAGPCTHLIKGQDVANSCVHYRMTQRGDDITPNPAQMPPLASDVADAAGIAAMEAWIATLPTP